MPELIMRVVPVAAVCLLSACQPLNYHLIYPSEPPPQVTAWREEVTRDDLLIRMEWAKPPGCGPFPTILLHPPGGKTAAQMKGVALDLAQHGYLAVAADYERRLDGKFRRNTFVWRSEADVVAALDVVSARSLSDPQRIATVGFSQGGIFSLLIAAQAPEKIRAVVAYYPVADFETWLNKWRPNPIRRFVYSVIRWHFRRESGAQTDAEFSEILRRASPLPQADRIVAPVLLVHGAADTSADAGESVRLARRLRELGRDVDLLIVPDAVHVFNFRQAEQGRAAWDKTLSWLAHHMGLESGSAAYSLRSLDPPAGQGPVSGRGE